MIEDIQSEHDVKKPIDHVSFLDTLADELAGTVNVNAVFGTAVERDGVTVIPVARARWGMGGGLGPHAVREGELRAERGVGGGGAAIMKPVGFIELAGGRAKFRSIREPIWMASAAVVTGILTFFGTIISATMRQPSVMARLKGRRRVRILSRLFR